MMEEIETQSDVVDESSSETQESSNTENNTADAKEASAKPSTELPFHEHPRWKEVIEQRNAADARAKSLEERYAQLDNQLKELSKPKDVTPDKRAAMIARLKGIDPEFADFVSELTPTAEVAKLRQDYQKMQETHFVNEAVNVVNKLHAENKVSPELQQKYNLELDQAYRDGKIRSQADVSTFYKQVHEGYNKLLEGIKRSERESYVAAKKADGKAPTTQPRGTSQKPGSKETWSKDPEERRAQIVAKYIREKGANEAL